MPDSSASASRRCPECGWSNDGAGVPRADWPLHWRRVVPAAVLLLAMAVVAARMYATHSTRRSGDGTPRTTILESPPFTYAKVREIAEQGGADDNPLCMSVASLVDRRASLGRPRPGDMLVDVGFFTTKLDRRHVFQFGWPSTWYERSEKARYADSVMRTGFIPWTTKADAELLDPDAFLPGADYMSPQKRWSWNRNRTGNIAFRPPVEETGGVKVNSDFFVRNIAASVGIVFLAWGVVRAGVWLANIILRRRAKQLRFRWLSFVVVFGVLGYITLLAVRSRQVTNEVTHFEVGTQQGNPKQAVYWTKSSVSRLPIRGAEIREMARQPGGDQRLARSILDSSGPATDTAYLGVEIAPEALTIGQHTSFGETIRIFSIHRYQYIRRPDAGPPDYLAMPPEETIAIDDGVFSWRSATGDATKPIIQRSINLHALGLAMLGFVLVWLCVRFLCDLWHRLQVRRRRTRGQCVNCGYILNPAA